MSVSMRVRVSVNANVNVNASVRGRLPCACVDRRGWQVDPRLDGGRQRQRQREGGGVQEFRSRCW